MSKSKSGDRERAGASSSDDREMFVTTDFGSIPAAEMRPMFDGIGSWIAAVLTHKILRRNSHPPYAVELRRLTKSKHVPKRIKKSFDDLKRALSTLAFEPNFDATVPALGPYSSAMMAMSRQDGETHFLATQIVTQAEGKIHDRSYFWFSTWMTDQTLVETVSDARLPAPRRGVKRLAVRSDDPAAVLRQHRERVRNEEILPVAAADLFERIEAENRQQTEDLVRRGVVRPATPGEVARIRSEMRV